MNLHELGEENEKIAGWLEEVATSNPTEEIAYLQANAEWVQAEALIHQAEILKDMGESLRYIATNTTALGA